MIYAHQNLRFNCLEEIFLRYTSEARVHVAAEHLQLDEEIYRNSSGLQIAWETNVSIMHKQTTKFLQIQRNVKNVKRKRLLGLHYECV